MPEVEKKKYNSNFWMSVDVVINKTMASKKKSQKTMLPHSKAKVEFYEKYLERYLPIMSLSPYITTIHIYDFFCGQGVYENGGEGSPIRALKSVVNVKKSKPSRTKFKLYLNDLSPKSVESVKDYIAQNIPDYKSCCDVEFSTEDAVKLLDELGTSLFRTRTDERNLLFIDPYGYSLIHKETIENILKNGKTEIILFLPVSFMHRFSGYAFDPDASNGVAPLRRFIEEFFPENHPMRKPDEEMNVHEYIDYLKDAFSFGDKYYTASYQIERERGKYFALFFMTHNLMGFEKILEVKWKLDEEDGNGFRLEKASPYVQMSLFEEDFAEAKRQEHSKKLREAMMDYLQEPRNNSEMYKFVMRKGYLKQHANGILKQLQDDGRLEVLDIASGNAVRKGSFYLTYEATKNPKVRFILK